MRQSTRARPAKALPLILLLIGGALLIPQAAGWRLRPAVPTGSIRSLLLPVALAAAVILLVPWAWLCRRRGERQLADALRALGEFRSCRAWVEDLPPRQRARMLRRLADVVDAQNMHPAGHSRRVAHHSRRLARHMGLTRAELARLGTAAAIHDVGKLSVPREILLKPSRLTAREFAVIERHCDEGALLVSALKDPDLTAIVRHHHERIDGTGYPAGLGGQEIPLGARIVAVADTFDAMTSVRPYRGPVSHAAALRELERCAGTQLDPEAVRTFVNCYSGWRRVLLLRSPGGRLHRRRPRRRITAPPAP